MGLARIAALTLTASAIAITGWCALPNSRDQNALALIAAAQAEPRPLAHSDVVNFRAFHDHLAHYGTWMTHSRWGAVWRPGNGRGFRPYRDGGHWEDTDDYGTVWVSDYSWGDIPFHYGRWVYDPDDGWIWVPGYVWAPAWVIWRAGEGNIGWLPMPPWSAYDGYGDFPDDWSDGYGYADNGFSEDAFDNLWCFIGADDLYAPGISYYVIGSRHYSDFIGRTKGWTRFSIYQGHVFNRSIDRDRFRLTFGHDPREGRRHDFRDRLGPVVDYASGRAIESHERSIAHTLAPVTTGTRSHYEFRSAPSGYGSHSVNLYRGSSSGGVHHVTSTAHLYHVPPTRHVTTTYHATTYHATSMVRSAPVQHAAPARGAPPSKPRS
jgi:hypothetical protein